MKTHSPAPRSRSRTPHSGRLEPDSFSPLKPSVSLGRRAGLKGTLRNLPSTLFIRGEPRQRDTATPPPIPIPQSRMGRPEKPRKGLANLFSRGKQTGTSSERSRSNSPILMLPGPGVRASSSTSRSTRSALSAWTNRTPPPAPPIVAQNKPRPSCPPDPFAATTAGASTVLPFSPERSTWVRDMAAERRTGSLSGIATVPIDDHDDNDDIDDSWVESVRNFDVPPPNQCNALPYNRLPTRRSSLGRVLDSRLYTIPEPTSHTLPKEPQRAPSHGFLKVDPYKSDKSRSKVWSMFGSKSKKTKAGGAALSPKSSPAQPIRRQDVSTPIFGENTVWAADLRPLDVDLSSETYKRRSLPKRKSLSGIFAFKKSTDKLTPATPQRLTPSSLSLQDELTNMATDASPDSRAFYSRFGNAAFNPELPLACQRSTPSLRPQASRPSIADTVSIQDVASATGQLFDLLSIIHSSGGSRQVGSSPARRKISVTRARSGRIVVTPGRSLRRTPARISPPVSADATPAREHAISPLSSMIKKGMRNVFASASPLVRSPGTPFSIREDSDGEVKARDEYGALSQDNQPTSASTYQDEQSASDASSLGHMPSPSPQAHMTFNEPQSYQMEEREYDYTEEIESVAEIGDNDDTFDFNKELAKLNLGPSQRASFLEALEIAHSDSGSFDNSPFKEYASAKVSKRSNKRSFSTRSTAPFRGQPAFQKFVAQSKPSEALLHPPPFALPPLPPMSRTTSHPQPNHHSHESAFSIASISSLGAPLEGVARDYTSFFSNWVDLPPLPPFAQMPTMSRYNSSDSMAGAWPHPKVHADHRRQSSGVSSDSTAEAEVSYASTVSVPSSAARLQLQRGSYLSRHRHNPSTDSTVGRPDWARHRRQSSSADSAVSLARLGRPGLGDRMFDRSQLTSIDGSPTEEGTVCAPSPPLSPEVEIKRFFTLSSTSSVGEVSTECSAESFGSSLFGIGPTQRCPGPIPSVFSLKGLRPLSGISMDSSANSHNDTSQTGPVSGLREKQVLSAQPPPARPRPPVSHRRRGPRVNLHDSETPGLTSDSISDASSLFSIETRQSNPPMVNPQYVGEARRKASVTGSVHIQPTIREEPSMSTIRPTSPHIVSLGTKTNEQLGVTKSWIAWQGECEHECHNAGPVQDDFTMPATADEITAFLAKSLAMYKPLKAAPVQHSVGRAPRHRTTSKARASPYAPPLPPPVNRFQSKKGSGSSGISELTLPELDYEPVSAIIAEFARDRPPSPSSFSAAETSLQSNVSSTAGSRPRVPSSVRRRNLGWTRRRNSDEPPQTLKAPVNDPPASATEPTFSPLPSFLAFSPNISAVPKVHTRPRPPKRIVRVDESGSPVNVTQKNSRAPLVTKAGRAPRPPPLAIKSMLNNAPTTMTKARAAPAFVPLRSTAEVPKKPTGPPRKKPVVRATTVRV